MTRGRGGAIAGPTIRPSFLPLRSWDISTYTAQNPRPGIGQRRRRHALTPRAQPRLCPARREGDVKQAEEASFTDLIACERDCRSCSYAAALDCDGNCGVCPHNSYCPCLNPVVARSKSALRLIELRPILLQDLQVRN